MRCALAILLAAAGAVAYYDPPAIDTACDACVAAPRAPVARPSGGVGTSANAIVWSTAPASNAGVVCTTTPISTAGTVSMGNWN